MATVEGFITTMPLLIIFLVAWIIAFSAWLFIKDYEKKGYCCFLAALFSLFIIVNANIEVRCVECTVQTCSDVCPNFGVFPIYELLYFHMGLFILELCLMFYYFTQYGFSLLSEKKP